MLADRVRMGKQTEDIITSPTVIYDGSQGDEFTTHLIGRSASPPSHKFLINPSSLEIQISHSGAAYFEHSKLIDFSKFSTLKVSHIVIDYNWVSSYNSMYIIEFDNAETYDWNKWTAEGYEIPQIENRTATVNLNISAINDIKPLQIGVASNVLSATMNGTIRFTRIEIE